MWESVGIVRNGEELSRALAEVEAMLAAVPGSPATDPPHSAVVARTLDAVESRNMLEVGRLIVASALQRRESRGLHYRSDYPGPDDVRFLSDTVLTRAF